MIKLQALEDFTLGKINEIKNLVRYQDRTHQENKIEKKDIFECEKDLANYLLNKPNTIYPTDKDGGNNPAQKGGRPVVEVVETIPEKGTEQKEEIKDEKVVAKRKITTRRKRTTKK